MCRRVILVWLAVVLAVVCARAQDSLVVEPLVEHTTGHKSPQPRFFALEGRVGAVLPTNAYIMDYGGPRSYSSLSLKYGILSRGDRWQDIAYGMPYGGIGIWSANFSKHTGHLGTPLALYLFSGGRFGRVTSKLSFNYEWNLGMSFGWRQYDAFTNPLNIAIGSTVSVYVGADFYFTWRLNPTIDVNMGVNLTHISNGDSRQPNNGLNMVSSMASLVCNINRPDPKRTYDPALVVPHFRRRIDHDLMFIVSSRQALIDTTGTDLPSPYVASKFAVLGVSYAMLFNNTYMLKWGPGVDVIYDQSGGVEMWREVNPHDGKLYDRTRLGTMSDRMSVGLAARGELVMPGYSIFANLGWNAIWGNREDARFYQVLGFKLYLKENMFGTFGIRASNFSEAQFLYWSLGYTFSGRTRHKRN